MTAQRKPKLQPDGFSVALKDWLSGEMSGHLGPYMYVADENDGRWKAGHSADNYYLGRDDKATFDMMLKELNVLTETVFDLGPGGSDSVVAKSIPIAQATLATNYIAVDLSPALAYAAAKQVSQKLETGGTALVANFFEDFIIPEPNALIALMGGTLGNLETHENKASLGKRLTQIFANYRRAITQSGFFLVSFDANPNISEVMGCYENPQLAQLVRGCVDRSIDTAGFDYRVTWTPETYQLALGLQSKQDQIVYFDGEGFAIEQNEFLPVLNSYRFPVPFVIETAAKAGWAHWKTWSATGRVHYLLFVAN